MFLIDSNIIIDHLEHGKYIDIHIFNEICSISLVSFMEIEFGNQRSSKRSNGSEVFKKFLSDFSIDVHEIDQSIGQYYVQIRLDLEKRGLPLPDFDILIAATAIAHDLTLVTNNKKHFERIKGLKIL